jgi:hypothetical protein
MMNRAKLLERQTALLKRRGKRPWDDRKEDAEWRFRLRLRRLFQSRLTDTEVGRIAGLNPGTVRLLRGARGEAKSG